MDPGRLHLVNHHHDLRAELCACSRDLFRFLWTEAADDSNNRLVSEFALSLTCSYAVSIHAGWRHTIAVMSDGTTKGWEYNIDGQAGTGDSVYLNTPGAIEGTAGVVAAGGGHRPVIGSDFRSTCFASSVRHRAVGMRRMSIATISRARSSVTSFLEQWFTILSLCTKRPRAQKKARK